MTRSLIDHFAAIYPVGLEGYMISEWGVVLAEPRGAATDWLNYSVSSGGVQNVLLQILALKS